MVYEVEERIFASIPGRRSSKFKCLKAGRKLVAKSEGRLVEGEPRAGGRGDGDCIGGCFVDYIMAPALVPKQWKSLKDCIQQ